jgi:hypothetical protein
MATKRNRNYLEDTAGFGVTGAVPTETDWEDLLASFLSLVDDDLSALTENTSPANDDLFYLLRSSDGAIMKIKYSSISSGGGGGEANDGENVGSSGVGIYEGKNGTNIQLRKLNATSGRITISHNDTEDRIDFDVSITKTDVGLSNVTNDAQLKRSEADWAGFSEHTTLVDNDEFLIEISTGSPVGEKRRLKHSTLKDNFAPRNLTNSAKTANYQLTDADDQTIIYCTNTIDIDIPTGLKAGFSCVIVNEGTGTITLDALSSVTLNTKESNTQLTAQYGAATIYHKGSNVFSAWGDLA